MIPTGHSILARFCRLVVRASIRAPRATIGVSLSVAMISVVYAAAVLESRTQRDDLLSADKACQVRWKLYTDRFGPDDDLVIVVQCPGRCARRREVCDRIAHELSKQPELFDRILHRIDPANLKAKALHLIPQAELDRIDRFTSRSAALFGTESATAWALLTPATMLAHLSASSDEHDTANAQSLKDWIIATLTADDPEIVPWPAFLDIAEIDRRFMPRDISTPDDALSMVLARPHASNATSVARSIVATIAEEFPDVTIGVTGLPALEADEMVASERDSSTAAASAFAGVAVLYFIVYRRLRTPLLTLSTLAIGTACALGWATLTVGHLNILSAAFAVMIIGLGDYGVLFVAHVDPIRGRGIDSHAALIMAAETVGPSILVAAATASLAFFSTILADFLAVAELGWIAGCGLLFCALACLTWLPALMAIRGTTAAMPSTTSLPAEIPARSRPPMRTLAVSSLVVAVAAMLAIMIEYDSNLLHLQATDTESVHWEHALIDHTAGLTWDAISLAHSPEEAIALRDRYAALPGVGQVVTAADMMPSPNPHRLRQIKSIHTRLADLPSVIIQPSESTWEADLHSLAALGIKLPVRADATSHAMLVARDLRLQQMLRNQVFRLLRKIQSLADPIPPTLSDIPQAVRERFVADGVWIVRAYAAESLWNVDALRRFTMAVQSIDPNATGKVFRTLEGLDAMRNGFLRAGLAALVVIIVVLWIDFRSLFDVCCGVVPLVVGMIATLAGLAITGTPLNPANFIALPLIIGVGLDNAVHVLHDARANSTVGHGRLSPATIRGIIVASLTTVIGFGTLMLARHRGMASLGLTLALGVSACTAASLTILPALLALRPSIRQFSLISAFQRRSSLSSSNR
jgi:uncharacterized protein